MVTSGNRLEPEGLGPVKKAIKLQVPVALDARVGGASGGVVGGVGGHNIAFELVTEIENMMFDTEPIRDSASIIDIAHGTTPRVAFASPQLHGDGNHLVTRVDQKRGCHRRVDPARHRHHHRRSAHVSPRRTWSNG